MSILLSMRFNDELGFASFREWNPSPEIIEAAEMLYTNIDNLELYVSLNQYQFIGPTD